MTTILMRRTVLLASTVCMALATTRATGTIMVAPASGAHDTWVRQINQGAIFVTDTTNSIWRQEGAVDVSSRVTLNQFNLSSVAQPITSAFILMAQQDSANLSQTNFAMAPAAWVNSSVQPGDLSAVNYSDYAFFIQPSETLFSALGGGSFAASTPTIGTYGTAVGGAASAADLAVLNTIRTSDGIITMIFRANSGTGRNFLSTEGGKPFLLVLNYVPGDFTGDGMVTLADYSILKTNWNQPVAILSNGDVNGDEFVNLADFVPFKQAYLSANAGGSAADIPLPVPEPSTLLLVAAAVPATLFLRRRRNRKLNLNADRSGRATCIS